MLSDLLTVRRRHALSGLLDDPSPIVRAAVIKELIRLGPAGIEFLEALCGGSNRLLAHHAQRLLVEIRNANPAEEFRRFIDSLNYELETGSIHLCRVAYPDLRPEEICSQIDAIAARCKELLVSPAPPRERCLVINRVLFHELGFRGNSEDYGNPENSYLNRVLATKKGLPISLSILYILVGQRIGASLDPIAYPGHFLVGCFEDDMPFFIDPFSGGKFRSPEQLLDFSQGGISLSQLSYLAPAPVREVLARCCRNLTNHHSNRGQEALGQLFRSFATDLERVQQKPANP